MNTPIPDPPAPVTPVRFEEPLDLEPLGAELAEIEIPEPDDDEEPVQREHPMRREEIDVLVDRVLEEELERLRDEVDASHAN